MGTIARSCDPHFRRLAASFPWVRDFDGNLIELMDLGHMYYVLGWLGPLGGWLFRRGMYRQYYLASPPG